MIDSLKKSLVFSLIALSLACSTNSARAKFTEESPKEKIYSLKEQYQALESENKLKDWAKLALGKINELEGKKEIANQIFKSIAKDQPAHLDAEVGLIRIAYQANKNAAINLAREDFTLESRLQKAERYDLLKELREYKESYFPTKIETPSEQSPELKLKNDLKKTWTKNEFNLALDLIKKYKTRYPNNSNSADLLYIEANCREELGQTQIANIQYRKIINSPLINIDYKIKSFKDLYRHQLEQGNLEETKKLLEEAVSFSTLETNKLKVKIRNDSSAINENLKSLKNLWFDRLHFYFWLAQTLDRLKVDPQESKELKDKIVKTAPLSYYRLLLNKDLIIDQSQTDACLQNIPGELTSKLETLKQLNLNEIADSEISWFFSKGATSYSQVSPLQTEQLRQISSKSYLHSQYGLGNKGVASADNALRLMSILFSEDKNANKCFPSLFYSSFTTPFLEYFEEASNKHKVPLSFLLAIARTESFFNPLAQSGKDALGMMQLLKSTAAEEGATSKDNLFIAKTNIEFGAKHLSTLLKYYDNNFILAAAAYNAGRDATNRWLNKTKIKNFDNLSEKASFVEQISYPETRNYVQRVFIAQAIYDSLAKKN